MSSSPDRSWATIIGCVMTLASTATDASALIDAPVVARMVEAPEAAHPVLLRMAGPALSDRARRLAPGDDQAIDVVNALRVDALDGQAELRAWLRERNIATRAYWLGNLIRIEATSSTIHTIARRKDVAAILLDRAWKQSLPLPAIESVAMPRAAEPGLTHIGVPLVWQAGVRGRDVVIGGQDTGYQWDHPALRGSYRGWDGDAAAHDYHWHDAIHALIGGGANPCGLDTQAPCDDRAHGTHTMGTMVGDDGAGNQIGVAPEARWIGCRNMEDGVGTPSTYTECFQWFMAPTRLDGSGADPSMAPHIINNSWGCPPEEGCTPVEIALMEDIVDSVRAAGILVVASAGNSGSGCGSIDTPPGMYASGFSVGATGASSDDIAGFSSRGPTPDNLLKPDVTAPGVSIRSTVPGDGYGQSSGTSMAGPHVAGVAALLMSVDPALRRNPAAVETILRQTAVPLASDQTCGEFIGTIIPNATYGHGRIDAWAAFQVAEKIFDHDFE